MKKIFKILVIILLFLFLLVVLAGIYKFNILQDDIYVENEDGEFVKWNDLEKK